MLGGVQLRQQKIRTVAQIKSFEKSWLSCRKTNDFLCSLLILPLVQKDGVALHLRLHCCSAAGIVLRMLREETAHEFDSFLHQ